MNFRQVAGNTLALCRPCPARWITLSPRAQAVAHAACCMNYATCSEHATQAAGAVAHNQDKCRSALRKKKREKNTKTKERSLWWWLMVQFLALVSGFSRPLIRLATRCDCDCAPACLCDLSVTLIGHFPGDSNWKFLSRSHIYHTEQLRDLS